MNVTFDDTPKPDAEQSFKPDDLAYFVDVPAYTQTADNLSVETPVKTATLQVEDVPVYEGSKDNEDQSHPQTARAEDTPENKHFKQAEKLNELDLNQAKKEGGSEAVARIKTGQDQNPVVDQQEKDKKDREFNNLLERLKEHRLWLLGMMDAIQDKIDGLTQKIEVCGRVIEALQDFKDGKIALGEDGYPANDKTREAIKDWERKNGKKWEPSTVEGMAALDAIILSEKAKRDGPGGYIEQREGKKAQWNELNNYLEQNEELQYKLSNNIELSEEDKANIEKTEKIKELAMRAENKLNLENKDLGNESNVAQEDSYAVGFSMPPSVG